MRSGTWSIVLAGAALLWLVAGIVLALWAMSDAAPAPVGVIAYILVVLGFFVVPILGVAALVLGIVALVRDRVPGKVLGGIGILIGAGLTVVVVSLILGSGGLLGAISF
jgi:hypothetical protein